MAQEYSSLFPAAIYLPALSCAVIILDIPPLIWHSRNGNLAATVLVVWVVIFNLIALVNSLVWGRDDRQHWFPGYGLCDFETYLIVAGWTGITSTLLCIMRSLANVLDTKNQVVSHTRSQRIRRTVIDAVLCFLPPFLQLCLFDAVKVNRYYIYGLNGCVPSIDSSWVSLVLIYVWPFIINLVVGFYAALVIVRLHRYRSEFAHLVQSHNTTRSRFVRLFVLSSLLLLGILPAQAMVLYLNILRQTASYSWLRNHDPIERSKIIALPAHGTLIPDRWISLACGLCLFIFFGLGTDASDMYRSWIMMLNPARLFRTRAPHRASFSGIESGPSSPSSRSMSSYNAYLMATSLSDSSSKEKPIWSTASVAPTIDTAISMTPLSQEIRKASVGTLAEDDVGTPSRSPREMETEQNKGDLEGLSMHMTSG